MVFSRGGGGRAPTTATPALVLTVTVALLAAAGARAKMTIRTMTDNYYEMIPSLHSGYGMDGYGFDLVAEPERDMSFTVSMDAEVDPMRSVYTWDLSYSDTNTVPYDAFDSPIEVWLREDDFLATTVRTKGKEQEKRKPSPTMKVHADASSTVTQVLSNMPTIHLTCRAEHAGTAWLLSVRESTASESLSVTMVCKYVRRELRSLSSADLERFQNALGVVYHMSMEEGLATYGETFQNHKAITMKHMGYNYQTTCTPYHDSLAFHTTHMAFVYEIERSMQLVDPGVSMAYWDYGADAQTMGTDWINSPVLSMLGTPDPVTGVLSGDGPLDFVEIPFMGLDWTGTSVNSYGLLVEAGNNNPSKFVTRYTSQGVCGYVASSMAQCDQLAAVYDAESFREFGSQLGISYHGPIHSLLGGAVDCEYELGWIADDYPALAPAVWRLASDASVGWMAMDRAVSNECALDSTFSACRPYNPALVKAMGEGDGTLTWSQAYSLYSDMWDSMLENFPGLFEIDSDDGSSTTYRFAGMTDAENTKLITHMTAYALSPGNMGHFTSVVGSTIEPLFGPTHVVYEQLLHIMRLRADKHDLDMSFVDDISCYGRSWKDELPFSNYFHDTSGKAYTNEDLYNIFDPTRIELPYVFDTLSPFCSAYNPAAVDEDSSSADAAAAAGKPAQQLEHGQHSESAIARRQRMKEQFAHAVEEQQQQRTQHPKAAAPKDSPAVFEVYEPKDGPVGAIRQHIKEMRASSVGRSQPHDSTRYLPKVATSPEGRMTGQKSTLIRPHSERTSARLSQRARPQPANSDLHPAAEQLDVSPSAQSVGGTHHLALWAMMAAVVAVVSMAVVFIRGRSPTPAHSADHVGLA